MEKDFKAESSLICKAAGRMEVHDDSGWGEMMGCGDDTRYTARKNQLSNHDWSIQYSRKRSKAGLPLLPTRRNPVDACQVAEATGNRKMKLSMLICNNIIIVSMKESYGVATIPATAS